MNRIKLVAALRILALNESKMALDFVKQFPKPSQEDLQKLVDKEGLQAEEISELMYDLRNLNIMNLDKPEPSKGPGGGDKEYFKQFPDVEFPVELKNLGFEDHSWHNDAAAFALWEKADYAIGVWVGGDLPEGEFLLVTYNYDSQGDVDMQGFDKDPQEHGKFKSLKELMTEINKMD